MEKYKKYMNNPDYEFIPYNSELEKNEVALLPNGQTKEFNSPTHENGGEPTNLPINSAVFSDKLKLGKKTFADLAKKHSTKKYEKILEDKNSTPLAKKTANKMMDNSKKNLTSLFNVQETMKSENFNTEFKKKFGGLIKKYSDGGTPLQDKLRKVYEAGVGKQDALTTQANQGAALWDVPEQYDSQPSVMIPWKPINFVNGRGLPRDPINPISPYNKPTVPSQGATPDSVMQPRTSPAFTNYPKPNWWDKNKNAVGKAGSEVGKGILNNFGNLAYLFNEGKKYDKVAPRTITPDYINADAQINEARQAGATGNYMLRNTFAGSPGALLSSLPQNAVQTGRTTAGIRSQVDAANAGISNQNKQFNSQVMTGADNAQQANKDAAYTAYYQYLTQLGKNTSQGVSDYDIKEQAKHRDFYLNNELLKLNKWMSDYYKKEKE